MSDRKRITKRTPERLIRAAYDFEHLASNLDHEGYGEEASAVRAAASHLGAVGRSMLDKFKM